MQIIESLHGFFISTFGGTKYVHQHFIPTLTGWYPYFKLERDLYTLPLPC